MTQVTWGSYRWGDGYLSALGALKDAQGAVLGALGIVEQAMAWLDAELDDLKEEEA